MSRLGFVDRRSSGTLPASVSRTYSSPKKNWFSPISSPKLVNKWEYRAVDSRGLLRNGEHVVAGADDHQIPVFYRKVDCVLDLLLTEIVLMILYSITIIFMPYLLYTFFQMQALVQLMLNSESGVPIRSHRNKLLSAVPSVFTGSDLINWFSRRLPCSKSEAMHVAILLYKHGYFYSVDREELQIKEDSTLFRFQTPHLWPSQKFDDSDFTYSIFLLKQIKRGKSRTITLTDYQMSSFRKLQQELKADWDEINARADEEFRILKDQKKVARQLITCQERAFWRLRRPPPDEPKVTDCFLTKFGVERQRNERRKSVKEEEGALVREVECLKRMIRSPRQQLNTSLDSIVQNCKQYSSYDPMLRIPPHGNPWTTNDENPWILERSLVEYPTERRVKRWALSFEDLLRDVTGRYNFEKFCKKQYSLENIKFWQAVKDLKMLPLTAVPGAVTLIYDEFIDPNATNMVNLSAKAFAEAERDLLNPSRYSFSLAQNEVYKLMETDIYPRFLNADFEFLLKTGQTSGSFGRSFLKKLISRTANSHQDRASPVEIVSPCHPQRYTKRELSISRSTHSAGSVDNIFLTTNYTSSGKQNVHVAEFMQTISNPGPDTNRLLSPDEARERRISAPNLSFKSRESSPSPSRLSQSSSSKSPSPTNMSRSDCGASSELEPVHEEEDLKRQEDREENAVKRKNYDRRSSNERAVRHSMIFSRSMEDLSNLAEEEDGMTLAMHKDTFEMGLMSLRTPQDPFNFFDGLNLDGENSRDAHDLFQDPEAGLSSAVTSSIKKNKGRGGVRPSLASLGVAMMTISVPKYNYQGSSSNESIHSTISAN